MKKSSTQSQVHKNSVSTPKIGLALSGGGVRGFAHIGAYQALAEHHIPIHLIAGTSVGGLMGAGIAAGHTADEIIEAACTLRGKDFFRIDRRSHYALLSPERSLAKLTRKLNATNFSDLKITLGIVTCDINTGQQVIISRGNVAHALTACIAIPGLFPPVEKGDALLVDGGLVNNFPVDVARTMGADIVIGVSVVTPITRLKEHRSGERFRVLNKPLFPIRKGQRIVQIISQAFNVITYTTSNIGLKTHPPDIFVHPPVFPKKFHNLSSFLFIRDKDIGDAQGIITAGYEEMSKQIPALKKLIHAHQQKMTRDHNNA